ncbi:hypothetical protein H072_5201 [Dactylellina haptotyla CBS 200.50]|uniref:GAF domain-containing protein n=1 Tax=Dactylellina haptotyla (strain CBS 200.50) TaxID=1284197 RepID=S8BN84_DACHA|nr:hypothetical protein H072_5201 [Dactylellina haptotyla CBS 200.50]
MFKLNIRRKDRSSSLDADLETIAIPNAPSKTRKHHSSPDEYPTIWNDSPVVNPLRNRPKPREERIPANWTNMTKKLNRAQTEVAGAPGIPRIPKLRVSTPDMRQRTSFPKTRTSDTSAARASDPSSIEYTMEIRHRRLLEEMANNCARDIEDRKEWGYWFKAYTEGRYNMSNPPQTPPRDPLLLWIPTPFPPNEVERLQALNRYDLINASHIDGDLRTVLRNTATALGAEYASISLVNYESETFLLNHPIRIGTETRTKRACSLGAHVMLSGDTMVIMDTKRDWRFKGNPSLGSRSSRIRFYAASPLISPDGYNIGILTISSRTPRTMFGKNDLRSLNNFANVVSTHLERLLPEHRRSIHIRKPSVDLDHRCTENNEPNGDSHDPVEETTLRESLEINSLQRMLSRSAKSRRTEVRLETEKKLTATSKVYDYYQGGLPVLPSLPILPTAIDILPPRTPPTPPAGSSLFTQRPIQRIYRPPTPPISPTEPPRSPPTPPIPLNLPLSSFQSPRNLEQARALISEIAKQIDFDYLYIIRLEPTSSKLTYKDLLAAQNFQIVMVHSYRRNPAPSGNANQALNTELHLKALRDRCGLTAVNARDSNGGRMNEDCYQIGALLPIQRDYVDYKGNMVAGPACGDGEITDKDGRVFRGYMLGAYKRKNNGEYKVAMDTLGSVAGRLGEMMFQTMIIVFTYPPSFFVLLSYCPDTYALVY